MGEHLLKVYSVLTHVRLYDMCKFYFSSLVAYGDGEHGCLGVGVGI
jgi:hypothetical protein